jgi:hypothetical protein
LADGTNAYRKAMEQRGLIDAQFAAEQARVNAQITSAAQQAAQRQAQFYEQVFSRVGSTFESTVAGLISRTTTWQRAEQQVAQSIVSAFVDAGMHMAAQWAATELGRLLTSQRTQAAILVSQEAGNTGFQTLLTKGLGIFDATETAKTTANAAGNAARVASNQTAESTENSWFIVRAAKWLASELGMTTDTVTQNATRTTTTMTEGALTALAEIKTAAAVAFANAYASECAVPVIGPGLAPEVAAAASAAVMASAASLPGLAVGAWDVPQDMVAQIHQGEMVVPATFAQGMRSSAAGGGGGGGGGSVALNVSINAIDTQSGAAFLAKQMPTLARQLQRYIGLNPSASPA